MRPTKQRRVTAGGLALLGLITMTGPALAQGQPDRKSGTGGAAGYSPPLDGAISGATRGLNPPPAADDALEARDPDRIAPSPENKKDESVPAGDTRTNR